MRHLRKFKESIQEDYEDYALSLFEVEPYFSDMGDGWYYARYYKIPDIIRYTYKESLRSDRFKGIKVLVKSERDLIDLLLVDPDYYKSSKYNTNNLKWERHPMSVSAEEGGFSGTLGSKLMNAKIVYGLPYNCSMISGMNSSGGIEFWPKSLDEPIYVDNDVELQYLLYKHCDI